MLSNSVVDLVKPRIHPQIWLAFIALVMAYALAWYFTPKQSWYEHLGKPDYVQVIPEKFGDWQDTGEIANVIVTPEQEGILKNIYSQTLARTYINVKTQRRIMLSVAHGVTLVYPKQMHWPEVCYPAQGFVVEKKFYDTVKLPPLEMPVTRLQVHQGMRGEYVTYFMRGGDQLVQGSLKLNLARIFLGLKGYIADGLLFRISEVSNNEALSYQLQNQFLQDLILHLNSKDQASILGKSL